MASNESSASMPSQAPAPAAGASDDNTITLNKREMRLGLRHRDSFAVHKSHIQHAHGDNREASIIAAITGQKTQGGAAAPVKAAQSSVAGMLDAARATAKSNSSTSGTSEETPANASSESNDDDDELGGLGDEGGADDDANATVTVNPDSEADILAALEALAGKGGHTGSSGDDANAMRKKNKLKSMVKGVATALGLRKSKKKRLQEEAAKGGGATSGAAGTSTAAGSTKPVPPILSPSAKALSAPRPPGTPVLLGGAEGATLEDLEQLAVGKALARPLPPTAVAGRGSKSFSAAAMSDSLSKARWVEHEPARDESSGTYLPSHRKEVRVPSILKGSPLSRKVLANAVAGTSSLSSGESAFVAGSPSTPSIGGTPLLGPPGQPSTGTGTGGRRGIVFADQTGAPLAQIHFSEQLHYGENSEHEDWDEEGESNSNCSIM